MSSKTGSDGLSRELDILTRHLRSKSPHWSTEDQELAIALLADIDAARKQWEQPELFVIDSDGVA